MASNQDCVFCRIIRNELPSARVYEDDACLAFRDIRPAAPTHILIVPKRHVDKLSLCGDGERDLLADLMLTARKAAAVDNLDAFRLIINDGPGAGQTVFHLHAHILGGGTMSEKLL